MNLEEMFTVLYGASRQQGAAFTETHRWFTACGVIDGFLLSEAMFNRAFERVAPNREPLTLTQFAQLIGILSRETRQGVPVFLARFRAVQQDIIDEIQARNREEERRYS